MLINRSPVVSLCAAWGHALLSLTRVDGRLPVFPAPPPPSRDRRLADLNDACFPFEREKGDCYPYRGGDFALAPPIRAVVAVVASLLSAGGREQSKSFVPTCVFHARSARRSSFILGRTFDTLAF